MRRHPRLRARLHCATIVSALLAGPLLLLASAFPARAETAGGYPVVPGSRGNVLEITLSGSSGEAVPQVEILARPAWMEAVELSLPDASTTRLAVRFDVAADAAVDRCAVLALHFTTSAPHAQATTRRWLLCTAAQAPAEQFDTRIEDCCIAASDVEIDPDGLPLRDRLLGSDPNPWSGTMRVRFALGPGGGAVTLRIHDISGRRVRELRTSALPAGYHQLRWDGEDDAGRTLPPGIYFYDISSGAWTERGRTLLLR